MNNRQNNDQHNDPHNQQDRPINQQSKQQQAQAKQQPNKGGMKDPSQVSGGQQGSPHHSGQDQNKR